MSDTHPYHCTNCNEAVTLRRREWDSKFIAACACSTRNVKIAEKSPEVWNADE